MRASALAAWPEWIGSFEGLWLDDGTRFQWLGLDAKGRPVTAYGCDLASPAAMQALAWNYAPPGAGPACPAVVAREWQRVFAMQAHAGEGAASRAFRESAVLLYDLASMGQWIARKLAGLERALERRIPTWSNRPAVVQLARMRTEWADGDDAWPKLDAAIAAGEWDVAAAECLPRDLATQPAEYRRSYRAVQQLYGLAEAFPGDELPDPLPDGAEPAPVNC